MDQSEQTPAHRFICYDAKLSALAFAILFGMCTIAQLVYYIAFNTVGVTWIDYASASFELIGNAAVIVATWTRTPFIYLIALFVRAISICVAVLLLIGVVFLFFYFESESRNFVELSNVRFSGINVHLFLGIAFGVIFIALTLHTLYAVAVWQAYNQAKEDKAYLKVALPSTGPVSDGTGPVSPVPAVVSSLAESVRNKSSEN